MRNFTIFLINISGLSFFCMTVLYAMFGSGNEAFIVPLILASGVLFSVRNLRASIFCLIFAILQASYSLNISSSENISVALKEMLTFTNGLEATTGFLIFSIIAVLLSAYSKAERALKIE